MDVGHVPDVDRHAVHRFDGHAVEGGDHLWAAVEFDVILGVADLGRSGGDDQVLVVDGGLHVLGRQAAAVKPHGVEIDHHLRRLAAPRLRHASTLHDAQTLDDEVGGIVAELLLGQCVAADRDLDDGDAGRAVLHDVRRRDARRHDLQNRLAGGRDLGDGRLDLGVRVKIDADNADAEQRLTLDVLDIVDRSRQHALIDEDDALLDLVGRHARILPDDADDRDIDLRKDVRLHPVDRHQAHRHHEQRHHHEGVGAAQSQSNDPHGVIFLRRDPNTTG